MSLLISDVNKKRSGYPVPTKAKMPPATDGKYERKYKVLHKIVKSLAYENAALCDRAAQLQRQLIIAQEERKYLLRKLLTLQQSPEPTEGLNKQSSSSAALSLTAPTPDALAKKKPAVKRPASKLPLPEDVKSEIGGRRSAQGRAKAKKMVQAVPLDALGRPVLPLTLGDLTIHSLGEVMSDKASYHDEQFIYTSGFCSTRAYAGVKNPHVACEYTCKIFDKDGQPHFEISTDSEPGLTISASTADECHALLLKKVYYALGLGSLPPPQCKGAEFFGYGHPTGHYLIQSLLGSKKLAKYKWQKFEVCKNPLQTSDLQQSETADPSLSVTALRRSLGLEPATSAPPNLEEQ